MANGVNAPRYVACHKDANEAAPQESTPPTDGEGNQEADGTPHEECLVKPDKHRILEVTLTILLTNATHLWCRHFE